MLLPAPSEVRKPKRSEISVVGHTYYWSDRLDGYHSQRVAIAVMGRKVSMVTEVTPVNERIMRLPTRHSLGVISVASVCARLS